MLKTIKVTPLFIEVFTACAAFLLVWGLIVDNTMETKSTGIVYGAFGFFTALSIVFFSDWIKERILKKAGVIPSYTKPKEGDVAKIIAEQEHTTLLKQVKELLETLTKQLPPIIQEKVEQQKSLSILSKPAKRRVLDMPSIMKQPSVADLVKLANPLAAIEQEIPIHQQVATQTTIHEEEYVVEQQIGDEIPEKKTDDDEIPEPSSVHQIIVPKIEHIETNEESDNSTNTDALDEDEQKKLDERFAVSPVKITLNKTKKTPTKAENDEDTNDDVDEEGS